MRKMCIFFTGTIFLFSRVIQADSSFSDENEKKTETLLVSNCRVKKVGPPGAKGDSAPAGLSGYGGFYFLGTGSAPYSKTIGNTTPVPYNNTSPGGAVGCLRHVDGSIEITDPTPGIQFWRIAYTIQLDVSGNNSHAVSLFKSTDGGVTYAAVPGSGINYGNPSLMDAANFELLTISIILPLKTGDRITVQSFDPNPAHTLLVLNSQDPFLQPTVPPSVINFAKLQ